MFEFVTHTWNPVGGECPHRCPYCYARVTSNRGAPECLVKKYFGQRPYLEERELLVNLGEDNSIFVCNMIDLFAEGVDDEAIAEVLSRISHFPKNTYLLLTKNPNRMWNFGNRIPSGTICGATIETDEYSDEYLSRFDHSLDFRHEIPPLPASRAPYLGLLADSGFPTMVSIEPIMKFDLENLVELVARCRPSFVAIGADSKKANLPEPSQDEVAALIEELKKFTEVRVKSNLSRIYGDD